MTSLARLELVSRRSPSIVARAATDDRGMTIGGDRRAPRGHRAWLPVTPQCGRRRDNLYTNAYGCTQYVQLLTHQANSRFVPYVVI
jgi:hypothetical protein